MKSLYINTRMRRGSFKLELALQIPGQGVTAILGPSGSGKTSLLRLIAGLERPQSGSLQVDDTLWFDSTHNICLPPQRRKAGVVFQDYALFEHLTVAQNIAYGVGKRDRDWAVRHWLQRLQLDGLEQRYPQQLSGGQRQRVALARALAPQPEILLLDEPLSAVDAHLRQNLRMEIKQLIHNLKQPVVMITHDLEDVRQMADHVGVMIDGRLRQFGKRAQVFEQPCSHEVARVMGWRNFLFIRSIKGQRISGDWGSLQLDHEVSVDSYSLAIRPEHIRLVSATEEGIKAEVVQVVELGALRELVCRLTDGSLMILHRPWNEPLPAEGTKVHLQLPQQHRRVLPERCEQGIYPAPETPHEEGLPGRKQA